MVMLMANDAQFMYMYAFYKHVFIKYYMYFIDVPDPIYKKNIKTT